MTESPALPRLEPISKAERIEALDILRGFALFGVFAVNIMGFAAPTWVPGYTAPAWSGLDAAAEFFIGNFLSLKFFTLFSFLFGAGFAVQMMRAEDSGRDFGSIYPRRLLALLAFGIIHHVLAWEGDILKLYALLGFGLLLFRKSGTRIIIFAAIVAWLIGSASNIVVETLDAMGGKADFTDYLSSTRIAFGSSGFLQASLFRLKELPLVFAALTFGQAGIAFAMFLTGLYVGRRGWLNRLAELPGLKPFVLASGIAGLGLIALSLCLPGELPSAIVEAFANVAMTAFYASGVLLLASRPERTGALAPLAAGGRMALTNYVLQSILASMTFYGYGLGLYEQVGPALRLGFVLVTYGLQLALSSWWLSRFRYGPLEWLWRGLTYGKLPAFRKAD